MAFTDGNEMLQPVPTHNIPNNIIYFIIAVIEVNKRVRKCK